MPPESSPAWSLRPSSLFPAACVNISTIFRAVLSKIPFLKSKSTDNNTATGSTSRNINPTPEFAPVQIIPAAVLTENVMPFLSAADLGRLECVCRYFRLIGEVVAQRQVRRRLRVREKSDNLFYINFSSTSFAYEDGNIDVPTSTSSQVDGVRLIEDEEENRISSANGGYDHAEDQHLRDEESATSISAAPRRSAEKKPERTPFDLVPYEKSAGESWKQVLHLWEAGFFTPGPLQQFDWRSLMRFPTSWKLAYFERYDHITLDEDLDNLIPENAKYVLAGAWQDVAVGEDSPARRGDATGSNEDEDGSALVKRIRDWYKGEGERISNPGAGASSSAGLLLDRNDEAGADPDVEGAELVSPESRTASQQAEGTTPQVERESVTARRTRVQNEDAGEGNDLAAGFLARAPPRFRAALRALFREAENNAEGEEEDEGAAGVFAGLRGVALDAGGESDDGEGDFEAVPERAREEEDPAGPAAPEVGMAEVDVVVEEPSASAAPAQEERRMLVGVPGINEDTAPSAPVDPGTASGNPAERVELLEQQAREKSPPAAQEDVAGPLPEINVSRASTLSKDSDGRAVSREKENPKSEAEHDLSDLEEPLDLGPPPILYAEYENPDCQTGVVQRLARFFTFSSQTRTNEPDANAENRPMFPFSRRPAAPGPSASTTSSPSTLALAAWAPAEIALRVTVERDDFFGGAVDASDNAWPAVPAPALQAHRRQLAGQPPFRRRAEGVDAAGEDINRTTSSSSRTSHRDHAPKLPQTTYWYRWRERSFGFAGSPNLFLRFADSAIAFFGEETDSERRLSWNLDRAESTGGWRAGAETELGGNPRNWYKVLLYRD
ncbi:unnamed protein product [Amoebophrya sp. A120]|nr:unnamed protein product [Amoebophrya sp. A120]|eukprot:GSA120T00023390001.1